MIEQSLYEAISANCTYTIQHKIKKANGVTTTAYSSKSLGKHHFLSKTKPRGCRALTYFWLAHSKTKSMSLRADSGIVNGW